MGHRLWEIATAAWFLILVLSASVIVPSFEGSDEPAHFVYVRYLWQEHKFPVLEARGQGLSDLTYIFHHPPLYYGVALLAFLPNPAALEQPFYYRPNAFFNYDIDLVATDNKNLWLHGTDENFPYSGIPRAAHVARALLSVLGLANVLALAYLGKLIFGDRHLALAATAFAALIPGYVYNSAVLNNDNAASLAGTFVLIFSWKVAGPSPQRRDWVCLGLAAGLAALSKFTTLAMLAAVGVAVLMALSEKESRQATAVNVAIAAAIWLGVVGWWFARNLAVYGELSGVKRLYEVMGEGGPPRFERLIPNLEWLWESFWGRLGMGGLPLPAPVYAAFAIVTLLTGLGWLRRLRAHQKPDRRWWILVVAILAMAAVVLYNGLINTTGTNGRYLYPILGAFAALATNGTLALSPARFQKWVCGTIWAGMMIIATAVIWLWLPIAYALPPRQPSLDSTPGVTPLDYEFGDSITLLGYGVSSTRVTPGDRLTVTLYWQTQRPLAEDYVDFVQLVDFDWNKVAQRDTFSGGGIYPTGRWKPGEIVADKVLLKIDPNTPGPQRYFLIGGLWSLKDHTRLPVASEKNQAAAGQYLLGEVVVAPTHPDVLPGEANPVGAQFGSGITLAGCLMDSSKLTLFWQAGTRVNGDYTIFMHLWDDASNFVAGLDHPPMGGRFPTAFWQSGDLIADMVSLPDGKYIARIDVGMYATADKQRLRVIQPANQDGIFSLPAACLPR